MHRMKLVAGSLTIELEADQDEFGAPLELALRTLAQMTQLVAPRASDGGTPNGMSPGGTLDQGAPKAGINTVVARLGGDSCRALLRAAAAHLSLVDEQETFTRDEWSSRAREARDWQSSFVPNQARDMKRMVAAGEIVERSKDVYSLPSKALNEAKAALASL